MLTTEPGLDVAPIHNRQVVLLRPENWMAWLALSKPEAELLRPLPASALSVETVRQGSGRVVLCLRGRAAPPVSVSISH